ncbi:MAG: chemotaxis protein CheD [Clostridia bacterium]|nr:chemotaxis protein CheD [Clostridia bacterium]
MTEKAISVGLGELHISKDPEKVLVCYGLGSCVGVSFYDPLLKLGALAHVVLPSSSMARVQDSLAKFADTCIPTMLQEITKMGANKSRLIVKIAGGAQVLKLPGQANRLDIGGRNISAVEEALAAEKLVVGNKDVGGNYGRTMQLYIGTGIVTIRTVGQGEKEL